MANDSCWIKPPGAPAVFYHRNSTYTTSINPNSIVTCWIALSDAIAAAGTLEYVPYSHRWDSTDSRRFLHAPQEDYRQPLWRAATEAGVTAPEIQVAEIPAGGCIFLHGDLWHGSGLNTTPDRTRRSFAVSTFSSEAQFQPLGVEYGYIYSRYRQIGSDAMDESFFPILWTQDEYRSPFANAYCEDALSK